MELITFSPARDKQYQKSFFKIKEMEDIESNNLQTALGFKTNSNIQNAFLCYHCLCGVFLEKYLNRK